MNKKSYTIKDFYDDYIEEYPSGIDYKQYRMILTDYYNILKDEVLYNSEEIKLPFKLGLVKIVKYKPKTYSSKSLSVDYKLSKELGTRVYHLNDHSDGYKYRLYWHKDIACNFSIYKYSLNFVRACKRELARLIKNKLTDYPEI